MIYVKKIHRLNRTVLFHTSYNQYCIRKYYGEENHKRYTQLKRGEIECISHNWNINDNDYQYAW
jgi:hypothetical protein